MKNELDQSLAKIMEESNHFGKLLSENRNRSSLLIIGTTDTEESKAVVGYIGNEQTLCDIIIKAMRREEQIAKTIIRACQQFVISKMAEDALGDLLPDFLQNLANNGKECECDDCLERRQKRNPTAN